MIPALHLPVGVTTTGDSVTLDLLYHPHTLVTGDSDYGVWEASAGILAAARAVGHQVIAITGTDNYADVADKTVGIENARDALDELAAEARQRRRQLRQAYALHWAGHPAMVPLTVVIEAAGDLLAGMPTDRPELTRALARLAAVGGPVGIYLHLTQTAVDAPLPPEVRDRVGTVVWAGGTAVTVYRPERLGDGDVQAVVTADGVDRCVLTRPVRCA